MKSIIKRCIWLFLALFITTGVTSLTGEGWLPVTKVSAQGPSKLSTSGYKHGMLNNFRVDAVDPDYVDGHFVNQFLEYYPKSRLRGHGDTIVRLADEYGINVVAYLGQIAKETTFGSATCGGQYNFGCYMWADWMGVGKIGPSTGHTQYDRDWADPGSVEQGIEIQMALIRNNYINKGYYYYPAYLERYSPAFENDHVSFGGLMYGVARSFGQNVNETRYKVPGGMSSRVELPVATVKVLRGEEVVNDHLLGVYDIPEVERVEFLEYVNTEQVTVEPQNVRVYVEFKDGTVKEGQVKIEVLPRTVEVHVYNADTREGQVYTLKEGKGVEIDVSEVLEEGKHYQLSTSEAELVKYYAQQKQGLGLIIEESDVVDGKIRLDIEGNTTVYLLTEIDQGDLNVEVDYAAVDELLAKV